MAPITPQTPPVRTRRLRLGFVDNLLTRPLVHGMDAVGGKADRQGYSDSEASKALAEGDLDIALVPSIETILHPEYTIVPTVCVGTFGGGGVAVLCSKVLPTEIASVLLDRDGCALEALLRVLLPRQGMQRAQLIRSESGLDQTAYNFVADPRQAFLLTGVAALKAQNRNFAWTWDILQAWKSFTNMPFVLWLWAVRPKVDLQGLDADLQALLVRNLSRVNELASEESKRTGIEQEIFTGLYTRVLHYTLDNIYLAGLRLFAKEACSAGVAPGKAPIRPYTPR